MRRYILFIIALCLQMAARGQTALDELDLSGLPQPTLAKALRYWFDDDPGSVQTFSTINSTHSIDVSSLHDGLHTIHCQIIDSEDKVATPYSAIFIKMNKMQGGGNVTAERLIYWFDDEEETTSVDMASGVMSLDASSLTDGLHTVHYLVACSDGSITSAYSSIFLRMNIDIFASTAKSLRYWFDNGTDVKTTSVADGMQSIDVSDLQPGLHTLHYQLVDCNGQLTSPTSDIFMKMFDKLLMEGQNRITQYQYWLNKNSQAMQTIELDDVSNPYSLIALLPMQKEPLQTSQFHFEETDGVPTIYAKNTFHIRFHDAQGYFTDGDKPFIDYSVKQEVVPVGELQATQTFDRVASNAIRWYTMQVAPGDTAAFKLSQPATVQVFAPSGAEVFKTSESASVKWSGIHTWEDGTYYLAVHDVTGSKEDMTLEYMHMDKYDVVDWDIHRVGNGGCSTITFMGNGFRDLYAVDLVIAPGDTIHSVDVSHDSDAEIAVTFDFTGAELGEYNAVFHFTEEDKHIANVITVEEAVDIELATDVSFPSSFLRGTSTTYTIKITNKGNMTAYQVPIYVYISVPSYKSITRLLLSGENFKTFSSFLYANESYESDTLKILEKEYGFLVNLISQKIKSVETGDSLFVYNGFIWQDVKPKSCATIKLTSFVSDKMFAWFTSPTLWKEKNERFIANPHRSTKIMNDNVSYKIKNSILDDFLECIRAREECYKETIIKRIPMGNPVGPSIAAPPLKIKRNTNGSDCDWYKELLFTCPSNDGGGGSSTPYEPRDPNDIYGSLSEAGSKFIADSVARVNYTIEFENDTTLATAAAHTIVIKDTLDSRYFDLTKFMPMGIKIGEHEAFLNEDDVVTTNDKTFFVKTIDMRPEINAIAQVNGTFNHTTGIAEWRFTSLDPMTMEPTDDLMQGILPVNYNGTSGIGEVLFEIGMKQGKADGTEIKNRAGIVFDYEEAILTPTWTNIVDAVAPSSVIDNSWMVNDSTLRITVDGFDARSGVWKYTWYVQAGENAPWWKEGETDSCSFDYHIYEGIDYGFCVLATDSAGNVEQKVIQRERSFKTYGPDYEDGISPFPTSPEEEEPIYDLSGRQIGNGKLSNRKHRKGVIIRNRKKTLVTE